MRDYSMIDNKWNVFYQYVINLDQNIWNLYDYIQEYNPNYITLNQGSVNTTDQISKYYYSPDELKTLKLIQEQSITNDLTNQAETAYIINPLHLRPHQILLQNWNNKAYIRYQSQDSNETLIEWPTGYMLLAKNPITLDWTQRTKDDFFISRIAAPAAFYALGNFTITNNYVNYPWLFKERAEINYGTEYIISFLHPNTSFRYNQRYNNITSHVANLQCREIPSFTIQKKGWQPNIITNDAELVGNKLINNSFWMEGYLLDHILYTNIDGQKITFKENDITTTHSVSLYDEIIADDTYQIKTANIENVSIPYYIINIPNTDNESFIQNFPMYFRLW